MLVSNQIVKTKWTKQNKNHYEKIGYSFTGFNKNFTVKAEDLPPQSHIKVQIVCDNCNKKHEKQWRDYLKYHSEDFGDLCFECCDVKRKKTCIEKYGEENPSQVQEFKEKRTQTHLDKYGVKNAFQSEEVKEKIKEINLEKYGYENVLQSPIFQERIKNTWFEIYGFNNPVKSEKIKQKIRKTCLTKYGAECPLSNKKVREKGRNTMFKNGTVPTSKPERETCKLLEDTYGKDNCVSGFPLDRITFDCLLEIGKDKIDVEYDGMYYHSKKMSYDNRRNRFVISRGYKVLRIKGNYKIPTEDQIKEAVDYLVKGNHSYAEIKLDI